MLKLLVWLGIFLIGVILGVFMKPRTVAITGAALMAVDIAGMILTAIFSNKPTELTWMFGIAMMLIPVIFVVVFMGASISEKIKKNAVLKGRH